MELQLGRIAGSAAIIRDGKILLLQRSAMTKLFPNHWTFPSGGIEPNDESAFETVIREVYEETSLRFTPTEKLSFYESHLDGKRYFALVFLGTAEGEIKLQTSEVTQAQFCSFDQAMELPFAYAYRDVLQDLKKRNLIQ